MFYVEPLPLRYLYNSWESGNNLDWNVTQSIVQYLKLKKLELYKLERMLVLVKV